MLSIDAVGHLSSANFSFLDEARPQARRESHPALGHANKFGVFVTT
jgi:hypothetical protein